MATKTLPMPSSQAQHGSAERVEMLKMRFAETIYKAELTRKTAGNKEKSRKKQVDVAKKMADFRRQQIERQRRAEREARENMPTVCLFDDNLKTLRDFEELLGAPPNSFLGYWPQEQSSSKPGHSF